MTTTVEPSAINITDVRTQIEYIEAMDKTNVWKFRALMAGIAANAEYARAAMLDEAPASVGYLGPFELAVGLRPNQYVHHAGAIADHALFWASATFEDQKSEDD